MNGQDNKAWLDALIAKYVTTPPEPGRLSVAQVVGDPRVASGPVGPLAALSHGTNALARFLYDQMPGQPGPMTPPAPVQKPDGTWGW